MILKSNGAKQDVKSKSIERREERDQPELNRTPESKVMAETVESRAADRASGLQSGNLTLAIGNLPDRSAIRNKKQPIDRAWEQIDRPCTKGETDRSGGAPIDR